jgi:hypothetical protein
MKLLLSAVAASVAALVLLSVASMPAGAARDAENVPVSQDAAKYSNLLDGKTFVTQSGEKGKQESNKDTFVFRDGRFLSEGCSPWNFGDAPYRATVDGGGIGLIAGMSRLFPFPKYLLLVCVAITPVPLLFLLRAVQQ